MYEDFNSLISGPWSYGPGRQPARRPLIARSPAGPVSVPWHERSYETLQPQLAGLGLTWDPDWFDWAPDEPYTVPPVTSYAPYCENLIPWVLGTALVVLLLTGGTKR